VQSRCARDGWYSPRTLCVVFVFKVERSRLNGSISLRLDETWRSVSANTTTWPRPAETNTTTGHRRRCRTSKEDIPPTVSEQHVVRARRTTNDARDNTISPDPQARTARGRCPNTRSPLTGRLPGAIGRPGPRGLAVWKGRPAAPGPGPRPATTTRTCT